MSEAPSSGGNPGRDQSRDPGPVRLREALRQARIEAADRTSVVVDLRDAEVARLEILNEALDPLFAEIPGHIDMFDRGISQGETPRLWIDVVAHIAMGRDKRLYRFMQDTRHGRIVLAEAHDVASVVRAVTEYVARRMVERERAISAPPPVAVATAAPVAVVPRVRPRSRFWPFLFGFVLGALALFGFALFTALKPH